MKNCGTCGAPVADTVEKCFKCGSPIRPAKDGPKLMRKFTKGKTVKRVSGKPLRKRPLKAVRKRKTTAEERQLKKLAGGDEGAVAARILRELIDEGAISKAKAASAEKLVGRLGAALPPSRPKPKAAPHHGRTLKRGHPRSLLSRRFPKARGQRRRELRGNV